MLVFQGVHKTSKHFHRSLGGKLHPPNTTSILWSLSEIAGVAPLCQQKPGDSSRDLLIPPLEVTIPPFKRSRFHHPKKVTKNCQEHVRNSWAKIPRKDLESSLQPSCNTIFFLSTWIHVIFLLKDSTWCPFDEVSTVKKYGVVFS